MKQIYDKVTYLQFARDDGVVIDREDKVRVILLFGRENKVVVAVAKTQKMTRKEQCECVYRDF